MLPSESPFPRHWWGTGLEEAGLAAERPDISTYGRYDFNRLPPLPFELKGDFSWLADLPEKAHCIGYQAGSKGQTRLEQDWAGLQEAVAGAGISLPPAFTTFLENPALHQRIRSNTDCCLNVAPGLVPSPVGNGYLIRFLADSQGCLYWYLFLTAAGDDHAVVCSPDFYEPGRTAPDPDDEDNFPPDPEEIVYCAESFEAFVCRYWLENEIWFAEYEEDSMPAVGQEYIERYRGK